MAFAETPEEVRGHAERMLAMRVGQFPVKKVLLEEKIAIEREFFSPSRSMMRPEALQP